MWNEGDEITFVKEGRFDSRSDYGFTIGKKYKIISVIRIPTGNVRQVNYEEDGFKYFVLNDQGDSYYIEQTSFELIKKSNPITEIDYLDCFKENFKHGY